MWCCKGADCVKQGRMWEICMGRGKSDAVQEIAFVDHPGDLRDAVEECLDSDDQYKVLK